MDLKEFIKCVIFNTKKNKFNNDVNNLIFHDYQNIIKIINKELTSTTLQDYERNFLTELLLFCTSMGSFLKTTSSEFSSGQDFFGSLEGQMIGYPVFRRLLEVCITQAYIFDEKAKIKSRFDDYCSDVNGEYSGRQFRKNNRTVNFSGLYSELKKINFPNLSLLPAPKIEKGNSKNTFNSKFKYIKNNKCSGGTTMYSWNELKAYYKILCFYTHGNVNGELLKSIYSNIHFPYIDNQVKFYNSLASIYKIILERNFTGLYNRLKPYIK